jgi:hypothetical protein
MPGPRRGIQRNPPEPVKFMKEKQVSEELRESRWVAQRIKFLKTRLLIKLRIG